MRERRRIVELWRRGGAVALVTLVRVEGSSYRRVGARLLVAGNGEYAGSISGGCLEAEVVRKAGWMVRDGAVVERYSTLFDDTAEIPYGLGCGGTVELLVEPAGTAEFEALMEALEASLQGVESAGGDVAAGGWAARCERGVVWHEVEREGGFEERIEAPQRLVVFGAGDDARPMVQMAALMGWNVVVVDGRAQWARAERFPEAELVMVASGSRSWRRWDWGEAMRWW